MVRQAVELGLEDKILFGTDHPFNHCHDQKTVVEGVEALGLSESTLAAIFRTNAERFFGA